MVVVNSVCGCAAGKARPAIALALEHAVKPDVVTTVFAGAEFQRRIARDSTSPAIRRPRPPWPS